MSAEKADHLPDLTLSFELLQSKDISRSHQPALTGNGCHGQAYTLWREEVTSPHLTLHFIRGRGAAALRVGLPSSPAVASGQGHLYVSRKGRPLT